MDWQRFLAIACCPGCGAGLSRDADGVGCDSGHRFALVDGRFPLFDPADPAVSERQQLEDEEQAAAYAGMRAFAAETLGRGESEGLYRTASDLLLRALRGRRVEAILDLGCGSGRTLVDCATAFADALVVGIDRNPGALLIAYAVACLAGEAARVDLRRWGIGQRSIRGRRLSNVFLAQASAERLPFATRPAWPGFDAITSVNLLDRVPNPCPVLDAVAALLRPSGALVLTSPLDWQQPDTSARSTLGDLDALSGAMERRGLCIENAFDGLVYRELHDVRGSAADWRVAVVQARRLA